jgi:hypothetical protein
MANCMALMCGGSFNDKIQAAFILFDENNSNSLSIDELNSFVRTIFKIIFDLMNKEDDEYSLSKINYDKLC